MSPITALHHPDVPTFAEWSARSNVWALLITCPYCHRVHMHGGGHGPEPDYGYRATHCLEIGNPDYRLVPGPPDMPRPKRQGRRHIPPARARHSVNSLDSVRGYVVSMEVHCKACRQAFEPKPESILDGTWRLCPECRRDGAPKRKRAGPA